MTRSVALIEQRRLNYERLRAVGFSCKDATRYKDRKQHIVDALIEAKKNTTAAFATEVARILS